MTAGQNRLRELRNAYVAAESELMDYDGPLMGEKAGQIATVLQNAKRAYFDAVHEALPALLSPEWQEERARLIEALACYGRDEKRFLEGKGEPYGSIPTEVGMAARWAMRQMEQPEAATPPLTPGEPVDYKKALEEAAALLDGTVCAHDDATEGEPLKVCYDGWEDGVHVMRSVEARDLARYLRERSTPPTPKMSAASEGEKGSGGRGYEY